MIFDVNTWVGAWPFRSLGETSPAALLERLDSAGIRWAAVSSVEAVFHRNVQPANQRLAQRLAGHRDRLFPLATINPACAGWETDLSECHEQLGMKGVRLVPQYHGYDVHGPEARQVAAVCRDRGLPMVIAHRLEDPRQRHWMDPGKVISLDQVAELMLAVPGITVIVTNARTIAPSALVQRPELRDRPWFVDLSLAEVHANLFGQGDLLTVIQQAGAQHILFGSHLPFSYAACALVKRAVLPVDPEMLANISFRTAARLFGCGELN